VGKHDIDILIVQLRDGRWTTRAEAARTLSDYPSPLARDDLLRCLDDGEERVRYWAVRALDALDLTGLTTALADRLHDPAASVRMVAARSLARSLDRAVLGRLLDVLGDPHQDVVYWAIEAAVGFGEHAIPQLLACFSHPIWRRREAASEALYRIGDPVVEPLLRGLEGEDPDLNFWAIKTLGRLRARKAIPRLREFLRADRKDLVCSAIEALSLLGDRDSLRTVVSFLGHSNQEVRDQAVSALATYGDVAVKLLADLLDGNRRMIKFAASEALGASGDGALVPLLEKLRVDSDELRYWAVRALAGFRSPVVVTLLVELLSDESGDVQLAVAEALGHFELPQEMAPRVLVHLGAEDWRIRRSLATALSRQQDWDLAVFRPWLKDEDENVRFWTVRVLAQQEDARAVDLLLDMFEDPAWPIRKAAAEALGGFGAEAVPRIRQAMVQRAGDSNQRYWLTRALVGVQEASLVPGLVNLLGDADQGVRQNSFDALVAMGDLAVPELLQSLRTLTTRSLREEVSRVLVAMRPVRLQEILDLLSYRDPDLSHWVTWILGHVGASAVPLLADRVASGSEQERYQALRALSWIEDPRTIQICLEVLEDEFPSLRRIAIQTLGDFRVEEAVPRLLPFLEAEEQDLRMAALGALARIPGEGVCEALLPHLESRRWEVLRSTVEALGVLGDVRAIAPLKGLLTEAHRDLWPFLLEALRKIGGEEDVTPLAALIEKTSGRELELLIRCMGALGGRGAASVIAPLLRHPRWEIREAAVEAYGELGEGMDPEPLKELARASDPLLRSRARQALQKVVGPAAWDHLLRGQLRKTLEDPAEEAYRQATECLQGGSRGEARRLLRVALRHCKRAEYYSLLGALCLEDGERSLALRYYRRACTLAPSDPVPLVKTGVILGMAGKTEKAASVLHKVLQFQALPAPVEELARRTLARLGQANEASGAGSPKDP
jgi:HEAT repeat protein